MIFITDIKEVVDNYGGKNSHFLLKIEGGEEIHLKCDKKEEKDRWVQSINALIEIYYDKKIFDWEDDRKSVRDKIDVRVLAIIMDEQESSRK